MQTDVPDQNDELNLRGFRGTLDYDIIAQLSNKTRRNQEGRQAAQVDAEWVRNVLADTDRLLIAEVNGEACNYVFVVKEGISQLDEFGTSEGKSWLLGGPICGTRFKDQQAAGKLLEAVSLRAMEQQVSQLVKFIKPSRSPEVERKTFEEQGFVQKLSYYAMRKELDTPASEPRVVPEQLKLIDFQGKEHIELLWSVLLPAFNYIEDYQESGERIKSIFASMKSAYFPICVEKETGIPVGTIALVQTGERGQIATFGVVPSHQRRGIGSMLMEQAIYHACQAGIRELELSVRIENPQAIRIYQHYGFKPQPEQTTIVLVKDLKIPLAVLLLKIEPHPVERSQEDPNQT